MNALTADQLETYRQAGHLTVADVFTAEQMDAALEDIARWSDEFRSTMTDEQRAWYLERGGTGDDISETPLRKLDQPVFERPAFAQLARHAALVDMVETLSGKGVSVFFSQVFMKPPGIGGPKPVH